MKLFALLLALVIERYLAEDASRWRSFTWLQQLHETLQDGAAQHAGKNSSSFWPLLPAGLSLLLPLLLLLLLSMVLSWIFGSWLLFVLGLPVLIYCLGPQDLQSQTRMLITAQDQQTLQQAAQALHIDLSVDPGEQQHAVTVAVFNAALARWFTIIFWFAAGGMLAALLYRLCERLLSDGLETPSTSEHENNWSAAHMLAQLRWLMEWPAAQLMVLLMALAGDFQHLYRLWHEPQSRALLRQSGHGFMLQLAVAQVGDAIDDAIPPNQRIAQHIAVSARVALQLLQRMLLILIALILLLMLTAWLL